MLLRDVRNCRKSNKPKTICVHVPDVDKTQVPPQIGNIGPLEGNENTQFGNVGYNEDDFAQMLDNAIEERMRHADLFTMSEDDQHIRAEDDGCFGPPLANVDADIFEAEFQEPLPLDQPQHFQDEPPLQFEDEQPQQLQDEQPRQGTDQPEMPPLLETELQTEVNCNF
jgi:hypothetical protein